MAVLFYCDQQWQLVKQQTFAWPCIIHALLLLIVSTTTYICQQSDFICIEKPLLLLPKFHHTIHRKHKLKPEQRVTAFTPPCSKTALIRKERHSTHSCHTHTAPQQSFIIWSHKHLSSQLTLWEAVIVCWLGICSGVVAFRQLRLFQSVPHWSRVCGRSQPAG